MAQFGRALGLGPSGREFESPQVDHPREAQRLCRGLIILWLQVRILSCGPEVNNAGVAERQTPRTQNPLPQGVWVRIPPPVPYESVVEWQTRSVEVAVRKGESSNLSRLTIWPRSSVGRATALQAVGH